jgi:hypothetical protein
MGNNPAIIIDEAGNVGINTGAPTPASSLVNAEFHMKGNVLLIEDATPVLRLDDTANQWNAEVVGSQLIFDRDGTDQIKVATDGIWGLRTATSLFHGINSDTDAFVGLQANDQTILRGWRTQVAAALDGSIFLKTKLDGVGGTHPNSTYGPLFVEGYTGNVGIWLNALPTTPGLQLGDASLADQMGISIFDGGANKMGFLNLMEQNNDLYLYQDTNQILRTHTAQPGASGDTTGATRVISQTVGAHQDPDLVAGTRPSDVEGCLVMQYNSTSETTRLYGRSADGSWYYTSLGLTGNESANWAFNSLAGASGTYYFGGYYDFSAANSNFVAPANYGTAGAAYAAHASLVLGANTVDTLTIRVSGASINDSGTLNLADTEDIVFTHPALQNDYAETSKKWLGQITFTHISGTAQVCNYGFAKYFDNANRDFLITGLEATWLAGATDANTNIELLHHKSTGWSYNGLGAPSPPTAIASMDVDHTAAYDGVVNGENGAYKRSNLNTLINGGGSEGTIVRITTNVNNAIEVGNFRLEFQSA